MSETEKKYFVNFGPELLQLLGPNLYTNIYYVLGELIANAYDADASNVYILYDKSENKIIVEDDGNGMSYQEMNSKFLPIGVPSRMNNDNVYTASGKRKRMGRKGIGKLAALSVAERVKVISVKEGEKSGCILSLDISKRNEEGKYEIPSIPQEDIRFEKVDESKSGSAVIMENSRYPIGKTLDSVKRNISLVFPFIDQEFRIHLQNLTDNTSTIIDDSIGELINLSDSLLTFADEESPYYAHIDNLHASFLPDRYYRSIKAALPAEELPEKKVLNQKYGTLKEELLIKNLSGEEKPYLLEIVGWIASYASTRDKARSSDFPANHISIIANNKLGQFDILPEISTDRLGESYVVGQFIVDLLELSELPDIASSNRQGYKEDDSRYLATLSLIKKYALRPILDLKDAATSEKNYLRELEKRKMLDESKEAFNRSIHEIVDDPEFKTVINNSTHIKQVLEEAWTLKDVLRESYKKILLSHSGEDKEIVDELEKAIHFCGFRKDEIIYSSSRYHESGFGAYVDIYAYLKTFFVDTVRRTDLCAIYILNEGFNRKWDPVLEAGAGWVLNTICYPMYTDRFENIKRPFPATEFTPKLSYNMTDKEVYTLADALHKIASRAGKHEKSLNDIYQYLKTTALYKEMHD